MLYIDSSSNDSALSLTQVQNPKIIARYKKYVVRGRAANWSLQQGGMYSL